MSLKLATAVAAALAVTSAPALACMGPTVIFQDDFQTENPAWASGGGGGAAISGGKAQMTPQVGGYYGDLVYEGQFIDSGDLCVDMVGPTLQDPTTGSAGVLLLINAANSFYAFVVEENGQAAVMLNQNGGWLTPVTMRAAPALKTGANVTNTLRVTWKGNSVSTYINGQPFVPFTIPQAFQNTMIGLYAENDAATGTAPFTYQFSNLKVTNVP